MRFALLLLLVVLVGPVHANNSKDVERGADLWSRCKGCHAIGIGARNKAGPQLNGLFGRAAASIEGFRYSKSLQRAGADGMIWDVRTLDAYLENPKSLVSGTRMVFPGLNDAGERRDLLAYLKTYSDSPADIPERAQTAAAINPDLDPALLNLQGDPAYGEYLASECMTCHQPSGADNGIPSIIGWSRDDFVTAMHAYKRKLRLHPAMRMIAGRLSDEEIASLAIYFEAIDLHNK